MKSKELVAVLVLDSSVSKLGGRVGPNPNKASVSSPDLFSELLLRSKKIESGTV